VIAEAAHPPAEIPDAIAAQANAESVEAESIEVDANDAVVAEGAPTTAEILASGENDDLAELAEDTDEESGSSRGAAAGS
jgi:hypothetical protein